MLPAAQALLPALRVAAPAGLDAPLAALAEAGPFAAPAAAPGAAAAPPLPAGRPTSAPAFEAVAPSGDGAAPVATPVASDPLTLAAVLWLGVAAALLGFWGAGHLVVWRMARRGVPAPAAHVRIMAECAARLGVRRRVRLLVSARERVPMTWGTLRPVVLLPAASAAWPAERLRRVLLHELAHVARADALAQSAARVVCALFWFHPGAWAAARALRREAEMACDDRVLHAAGTPVAYAEDLLGLSRTLLPRAPAAAVPMAGRSGLDQRIRGILESGRARGLGRSGAVLLALAVAAVVAIPAAVRWAEASGGAGDWLRADALSDGRAVWSMECPPAGDPVCGTATRGALALLERTGRTGVVVVQRVSTGEISAYAAVRRPGADRADAVPLAAPGSVAKLSLATLWWQHGGSDAAVPCPATLRRPSGRTVANAGRGDRGAITVEEMLAHSCNTAAVTLGDSLVARLGAAAFVDGVAGTALAGIPAGDAYGADEAFWAAPADRRAGWTAPPRPRLAADGTEAEDVLLAAVGIGSGRTTPLHVSRFLQAAGNDGVLLPPRPAGADAAVAPGTRVMSADAAARLRRAMARAVRDGTAARTLPQLEWSRWTLGGKTGSLPAADGDGLDGWFAGLAHAPDGRAEYTVVVWLESGGIGGGAPAGIAAEMTRLIARARGDEL
jgi:beta-lactamase regulating signal transducer with metallopeptidase domain